MAHPLRSKVEDKVKSAPVVIFMKGTPDFPMCGFSNRAVQVLRAAGAQQLAAVDVLAGRARAVGRLPVKLEPR